MAIIETTPGIYKKVSFLMLTARTSGGRKDAVFEYPNSNRQSVEDLGLKVRSYNMTIVIPNEDYYAKRDAILSVLEDGKKGTLTHPTFGDVENVAVRSFILNEKITELGRAEIQIVFVIDDNIGIPQKAANSISELNQDNNLLSGVLNSDIANGFEVETRFLGNFQDAQELLGRVADTFNTAVSTVTQVTTKVNQFSSQLNAFNDTINTLISTPQDLADSVTNLFSTVNGLYGSSESAVIVYKQFFSFGDDDIQINETTAGLVQRSNNRTAINEMMQASSLGYAYLNAAQIEFQTTNEIDDLNNDLDAQYEKIMSNEEYSEDSRRQITDVRTIANKLFDDKRLVAKKVIEIYTQRMPMSEIAYQYYGSTDLTDTLLELNIISNDAFVDGTIKILTE